ncbi:tRNA-specific adenosine deaminase [Afifella pfennigii]|uniref:nucleoside deaminase n=1 Tax=Afifella pfennigii TaxID=209897 RepID=UPI0004799680|nr:nucleoside deaminase [Afifella pfennigii]
MPHEPGRVAARYLSVIEEEIVPLTEAGVVAGNKLFGAAILKKDDLSLVVAASNRERENPLLHGEVAALNAFFAIPATARPAARECLFLATHEPCSLCLSAITWAGFDNFTYLFAYEDTRDAFSIPHDLAILREVFGVEGGAYRRDNAFWSGRALSELVAAAPEEERRALAERQGALAKVYARLSETYQAKKGGSGIALS